MEQAGRAALGRFVLRTKEYLVAIRVREGALALTTMRFHDEVRDLDGVPGAGGRTKPKEVAQAVKLIESLSVDWDPGRYEDEYRKRLQAIVRKKRQGGEIKRPQIDPDRTQPVPDLMAALEASMARAKGDSLDDLSREELYERASDADVPGRSKMSKKELADALRE
jgi:DNA end-binding protein Ku